MIEIKDLRKQFDQLPVLNGINLRIGNGEITAIVGPNGAGKTTLIKSVLGLVKPQGGTIVIDGEALNGHWAYREKIGYMPQAARFPENLRVEELIFLMKDLRGRPANLDEELFEKFNLATELKKPLRTLSGGTRQKLSAMLAFLFHPQIYILDEPTAGLDPVASSILKDKIRREKALGKTIILTSHIMSELEELADNIVFLLEGKIAYLGSLDDMKAAAGAATLERTIARMMEGGVTA